MSSISTILVIDDDPLVRRMVIRMLTAAGHDVREAPSGASGLSLWRDGSADLVLTDIAMPDMTGFELIAEIRALSPTVPIVAMSGSVVLQDLEAIQRAEALGAVHLLSKPFSWDELMATIGAALSQAR